MIHADAIEQDLMAEAADEAANVLRALSNPSRLLLLCRLVEGERSVGELVARLGLTQAYVSQQLSRLRAMGLVQCRREGRSVLYRLGDPRLVPVIEAVHHAFCASRDGSPG